MCTLGLFILWQSSWQAPPVSSFARGALGEQISNKHKRAHTHTHTTQTSNRPWAKVLVQTDEMNKLAFTDKHASMNKHLRARLHSQKQYLSLSKGQHCLLCHVCVQFVSHLSLTPMRGKTRLSKLPVCYITSCNLYFSAEPGQPVLNHHEC